VVSEVSRLHPLNGENFMVTMVGNEGNIESLSIISAIAAIRRDDRSISLIASTA